MATLPIQTEIDELAEGLTFVPLRFSRNKNLHVIDAADINLASRARLKYFLELQTPEYKYFGDWIAYHRSEGREVPIEASEGVYQGARFVFNEKNGKLDGCLEFIKPKRNASGLMVVVQQTLQYRLRELVTQDSPAVNTDVMLTPSWMIKAGLHPVDYEKHSETFFSTRQVTKRQFLTWQPDNLVVGKEERWLSFVMNFTPRPTKVKLRVRLSDANNNYEVVTKQTVSVGNFGQVIVAPIGVEQLGINTDTIVRYEVWLSDQDDNRISEVRTYWIDCQYRRFDRAIHFINQLGGWDTLRFLGQAAENLKVTKYKAERERTDNPSIEYVDTFIIDTEGEEEITLSTGYFERNALEHQKHLQSLLFSERVYLQTEKGHHYLELITNAIEKKRDNVDLIAYQLVFRKSGIIQNYSDLEPSETTGGRETGWRGIDYKHVLDAFGKRTGYVIPQRIERYYIDNNSLFKPYTVRPNIIGVDGYIDEQKLPNYDDVVGTTPFPSTEINREGSYIRSACAVGTPGPATIIVAAAKYGGEKAGDANVLAEAEAAAMDTQSYADTYGACYPDPWNYGAVVPAGYAKFRISHSKTPGVTQSDNFVTKSNNSNTVSKGNGWWLQIDFAGDVDVYLPGTWDINLPTTFATDVNWRFGVYGTDTQVRVWVNGVSVYQGSNNGEWFMAHYVPHATIPSQAKVYIEIF